MYRILALNGGGVRGYLTLKTLAYIEKISGCKIKDIFDLVVGTSSGALVGSMLHMPPETISNYLRTSYKDKLFKPNWLSFGGLLSTKYNTKTKEELIDEIVGSSNIDRGYDFAALSYDIKSNRPVIFNTIEYEDTSKYLLTTKYNFSDAVKASSAAPIYWDPYVLDEMILIDGAIVGNDPTDVGIKLGLKEGRNLNDLYIVNVTSGNNTRGYKFKSGANPLKWSVPTINMLMNSQPNMTSMLYLNEGLEYYNLDGDLIHGSDSIDDISDENFFALDLDVENLIKLNYKSITKIVKDLCNS